MAAAIAGRFTPAAGELWERGDDRRFVERVGRWSVWYRRLRDGTLRQTSLTGWSYWVRRRDQRGQGEPDPETFARVVSNNTTEGAR